MKWSGQTRKPEGVEKVILKVDKVAEVANAEDVKDEF